MPKFIQSGDKWQNNGDDDYWIEPRVEVPTMTVYETRVKQPIGFIHWNTSKMLSNKVGDNKKVKKR